MSMDNKEMQIKTLMSTITYIFMRTAEIKTSDNLVVLVRIWRNWISYWFWECENGTTTMEYSLAVS